MTKLLTKGTLDGNALPLMPEYLFGPMDVFESCLSVHPYSSTPNDASLYLTKQSAPKVSTFSADQLWLVDNSAAVDLIEGVRVGDKGLTSFHTLGAAPGQQIMNAPGLGYQHLTFSQPISPSGSYVYVPGAAPTMNDWISALVSSSLNKIKRLSKFVKLKGEVEELGRLAENWDSDGAMAISNKTVANAIELLQTTASVDYIDPPSVGPMPDGRISFTLEMAPRELWVYVNETSYVSYQWENAHQFESVVRTWSDANQVAEYLEWLKT